MTGATKEACGVLWPETHEERKRSTWVELTDELRQTFVDRDAVYFEVLLVRVLDTANIPRLRNARTKP